MFSSPLFITNFKAYEQSTGMNAVTLAKIHEKIAHESGASLAIAVSSVDVYRVAKEVSIPVFAQHIDPIDYGSFTGHILPQSIKNAGAVGTLLNHSERRIDSEVLENTISCAQKASLIRVVCAETPEEVEKFSEFDPDFLAFEPPELIGSTSKSVSTEAPKSIEDSVRAARGVPVMVGAGINSAKDIEVALRLGARGFLVATAVAKSQDPEKRLREFVAALK